MHPPHRMRRSPGSKLAALIAILAVGWLTLHSEALARPRLTADSLAAPGPFAVGITTLTLVDPSRPTAASGAYAGSPVRTLVTDVYYPSTTGGRGAPLDPSGGPFPLLVFAHGLGGARTNFAATLTHLASRGYVVVAPDFPLTGLVNFLTGTVLGRACRGSLRGGGRPRSRRAPRSLVRRRHRHALRLRRAARGPTCAGGGSGGALLVPLR